MLPEDRFFETMDKKKIWERYCGFLDLSLEEYMKIQHRLLMEQIKMVADTPLGKKIMKGTKPRSVEEFRQLIPLTTYDEYEPYLGQQREDVLAEKPLYWGHSAGRGGRFKWIPYTRRGFEVSVKCGLAAFILSAASSKGEVNLKPGTRFLVLVPSRPYASGMLFYHWGQQFSFSYIPPLEQAETMEFQDRIATGFGLALRTGVDLIFAIASVLVKVGETMTEQAQSMRFSLDLLRPPVLLRLLRALLLSKIARRPILPKDLWRPKAIITGGTDTSIYKEKIAYYWGQTPYEGYGATEGFPLAMQSWNKKGLIFPPDLAFWEFIPEEELKKSVEDSDYEPAAVLFDEVEQGRTYEVVLTHFYGMPLLRYRMGDLVTFVDMRDEEADINLPHMVFKSRRGETINLGGLTDLDEKTIWRAIENSGVKYSDWLARKEYDGGQTYLRIYLELKENRDVNEIEQLFDQQLKAIDIDYRDVGDMIGLQPVRVTLLTPRTFQRYFEDKQKEGADLAHLKPPHMNASEAVIQKVLQLSQER